MEFAIGSLGNISNLDYVRQAEDLGFSHYGIGDGPLLYSDPYIYLALAAERTSAIKLGTFVTNPLTRTPPATANALATLNQLAPGRIFFGIGAANNALRSMGVRVARVAEIEDAVRVFRGLMSGERVSNDWLGVERDIQFLDQGAGWYNVEDQIPVWISAGGPRTLELGARYADYVVYCLGPDEDLIRLVRETIDRGAIAAGRKPEDVRLVGLTWFYLTRPGEGLTEAIEQGFGHGPVVSGLTNIALMRDSREALGDRIVDFAIAATKNYVDEGDSKAPDHLETYRTHMNGQLSPANVALIDEYAADYFAVWGDHDRCNEQLQRMRDAGVDLPCVFLTNPRTYERDLNDLSRTFLS
jgi:alkanesulfonate monooxygenase SsuD/methylene tetrahydromethanopterin reductase-like flavin-dependent oxidoreductase (luciferase family)